MRKKTKISVIGLGYVGFPLAVEFSQFYDVVGFDLCEERVNELNNGYDRTNEISGKEFKNISNLKISSDQDCIADSNIYIITVPTPVDKNNIPNLNPLKSASSTVGNFLKKDNIIIYESTVFPGCTEEICVPILEKKSGLKYNYEFFCGYSPERINPGDKKHKINSIVKIISGSDDKTTEIVDRLYASIISAGTFKASSIRVAEAAKVIENTQRDVNIALINELAIIFDKLNIDTSEVLEAATTKWNFLPFKPGLVGGHCIGVDPYYLTYKAAEVDYHPEVILSGRRINDSIGKFIADKTIAEIAKKNISPLGAKIGILGLTFKENCPDLRNTKVAEIVDQLKKYDCKLTLSDEWADSEEAKKQFGVSISNLDNFIKLDAIIVAVSHNSYCQLTKSDWAKMLNSEGVLIDVKSVYDKNLFSGTKITHWRF